MKLLMYGVSLDTISTDEIDRYQVYGTSIKRDISLIKNMQGVEEALLLNTDFRTELYLFVDETLFQHGELLRYFAEFTGKNLTEIILETYSKFNEDVISHLYSYLLGFTPDQDQVYQRLEYIEQALIEAKEDLQTMKVLSDLMSSVIKVASALSLNPNFIPISQKSVAKIVPLITEASKQKENLNFVMIGYHPKILFIAKLLLINGSDSVTIVADDKSCEETLINQIDELKKIDPLQDKLKNFYITTLDNSAYRLSAADVFIFLNEGQSAFKEEEFLKEIAATRLTLKNQVYVEIEDLDKQEFSLFTNYDHIKIKKTQRTYTDEDRLNAQGYMHSTIEDISKHFIEEHSITNEL